MAHPAQCALTACLPRPEARLVCASTLLISLCVLNSSTLRPARKGRLPARHAHRADGLLHLQLLYCEELLLVKCVLAEGKGSGVPCFGRSADIRELTSKVSGRPERLGGSG